MHTYIFSFSRLKTAPAPVPLSLPVPAWHCAQTCHASYIMLTHTHIHTHAYVCVHQLWQTSNICIRMCTVCVFIIIKAHIA